MFRPLLPCLLLMPLLALGLQAPPGAPPPKAEDIETLVRLQVEPMAPPRPALKYQLLPEAKELQPGNPIHGYARCFAEYHEFFYDKEALVRYKEWMDLPLAELTTEVRAYVDAGPLKRFDDAARLDRPYWGMIQELKRDGVSTLLPDLQLLRHLAGWNRIRIRYALTERRFDDAIAHAKSGFQLARHLDENQTLIGDLVGVAIGVVTCQAMEEMLNQPGAPNLFWAWSSLPSPLVPIVNGVRGEFAMVFADFGDLCDPKRVWGEEDLAEVMQKVKVLPTYADFSGKDVDALTAWATPRLTDAKWLAESRKECVAQGFPPPKVKRYPPEQLVFHALLRKFVVGRDDAAKYVHLPFTQVQDRLGERNDRPTADAAVDQICSRFLTGNFWQVKLAQTRLEQRLAMLRIVEALRWYAGENDGRFPQKLANFKEPLPNDPVTGKPFKYEYDGEVAHLRGTPPKGMEELRGYNVHYEVTLRK
jgi:hypothetical protein